MLSNAITHLVDNLLLKAVSFRTWIPRRLLVFHARHSSPSHFLNQIPNSYHNQRDSGDGEYNNQTGEFRAHLVVTGGCSTVEKLCISFVDSMSLLLL